MFANDDNEKNIQTYATLLQDIREGIDEATHMGKKPKNLVHAAALDHSNIIKNVTDGYEDDPYKTYDASHLKDKSRHEVDQLNRSHTKLVDIHRAHATIHSAHGNHEAVVAHTKAAKLHKHCADVSDWDYGMPTSHEEFSDAASTASHRGSEALKNHPLTSKMFSSKK
tara:strand:+ start:2623 stop:3126 length:504 start_codon:yes stop_codon:yes gene_type:complete